MCGNKAVGTYGVRTYCQQHLDELFRNERMRNNEKILKERNEPPQETKPLENTNEKIEHCEFCKSLLFTGKVVICRECYTGYKQLEAVTDLVNRLISRIDENGKTLLNENKQEFESFFKGQDLFRRKLINQIMKLELPVKILQIEKAVEEYKQTPEYQIENYDMAECKRAFTEHRHSGEEYNRLVKRHRELKEKEETKK